MRSLLPTTERAATGARLIVALVALTAGIFVLDLSLPLGVAGGMPYVAVVLASLWSRHRRLVLVTAAAGTVLTILGYFLSPSGGMPWVVLTNRVLTVFAIWVTAAFCFQRKRIEDILRDARAELEVRVQERTTDLVAANRRLEEGIAETKRVEEASRLVSHVLDAYFDSTLTCLVLLDRDFNFIRVNRAYARVCRRDVSEFTVHNHFEFYPSDTKAIFENVVKTGEPYQTIARPFVFPDHPERGVTYWDWTLVPILNGKGEVEQLVFSLIDVTERRHAEEERGRLEEQLRQASKMEAVGTLAAGVAHDFNNTLTAVLGYAEVVRLLLPKEHEARQALDGIVKAGKQGSGVTKSLLTFSRRAVGERRSVDVGRIVKESIAMLRPMLPAAIELVTEVSSSEDLWVEGDAVQLQQVVVNLAVNARDAMPEGGRLRITLEHQLVDAPDVWSDVITRGNGVVLLVVEDNGSGMSEELRSRIFEPFFTSKERGQGTGLGMAIVHGVVADHDGQIRVESTEGKGTRITVALPCCDPSDIRAAQPNDHPELRGNGETLILAEDDRLVRAVIATTLGDSGYNVIQASDGYEVLGAFDMHESSARLLILDMDLPKLSGVACLRRIREHHPDIPAIIISGLLGLRSGDMEDNTVLLRKPFEASELASLVSRTLEHSPAGESRDHDGNQNTSR